MAACGAVLVLGGPAGLLLGLVLLLVGPRLLSRLEPAGARREADMLAADLPMALELLASCLAGGAGLLEGVRAVAPAVGGPCGRCLHQVGAALAVGSTAEQAWAPLAAAGEVGAAAARALVRAAEGGAPVAAAVARLAGDARTASAARATEAARRAGVLAVAPLGLCFLPAFVLLGVVPAVVGLAAPLLASL